MSFHSKTQSKLSVGMDNDSSNLHRLCQLEPITETRNLFFSLFFPSDFSEIIGEKQFMNSDNTLF